LKLQDKILSCILKFWCFHTIACKI